MTTKQKTDYRRAGVACQTGVFAGQFTLRRADFAIGEGPWAAFDVVANEVQIQFRITAHTGE